MHSFQLPCAGLRPQNSRSGLRAPGPGAFAWKGGWGGGTLHCKDHFIPDRGSCLHMDSSCIGNGQAGERADSPGKWATRGGPGQPIAPRLRAAGGGQCALDTGPAEERDPTAEWGAEMVAPSVILKVGIWQYFWMRYLPFPTVVFCSIS